MKSISRGIRIPAELDVAIRKRIESQVIMPESYNEFVVRALRNEVLRKR